MRCAPSSPYPLCPDRKADTRRSYRDGRPRYPGCLSDSRMHSAMPQALVFFDFVRDGLTAGKHGAHLSDDLQSHIFRKAILDVILRIRPIPIMCGLQDCGDHVLRDGVPVCGILLRPDLLEEYSTYGDAVAKRSEEHT